VRRVLDTIGLILAALHDIDRDERSFRIAIGEAQVPLPVDYLEPCGGRALRARRLHLNGQLNGFSWQGPRYGHSCR
jgi:hypothetical protein